MLSSVAELEPHAEEEKTFTVTNPKSNEVNISLEDFGVDGSGIEITKVENPG